MVASVRNHSTNWTFYIGTFKTMAKHSFLTSKSLFLERQQRGEAEEWIMKCLFNGVWKLLISELWLVIVKVTC